MRRREAGTAKLGLAATVSILVGLIAIDSASAAAPPTTTPVTTLAPTTAVATTAVPTTVAPTTTIAAPPTIAARPAQRVASPVPDLKIRPTSLPLRRMGITLAVLIAALAITGFIYGKVRSRIPAVAVPSAAPVVPPPPGRGSPPPPPVALPPPLPPADDSAIFGPPPMP